MRLAFSTNAYIRYSLKEAILRIKACGYEGVEILADTPHVFPPYCDVRTVKKVGRLLEQTGLEISNLNANTALGFYPQLSSCGETIFEPSLCNQDREVRLAKILYLRKCIDLAAMWGAPCISITSGRCLPGNPPEQAYKYFISSLEQILEYAEKKGILIGIEYEPGLLIENAQEMDSLLKDLPSSYLGVNLDLGHAYVGGESLKDTIEAFSKKIWNIHLEDIVKRKHYHLVPGEGEINFKEVLNSLRNINYDRYLTVELYTYPHKADEVARCSFTYLKRLIMEG